MKDEEMLNLAKMLRRHAEKLRNQGDSERAKSCVEEAELIEKVTERES